MHVVRAGGAASLRSGQRVRRPLRLRQYPHARNDWGGAYDRGRELTVQLTPEEIPAAMAVLMSLSASARFGQHGADRDKFILLRHQKSGLAVVSGQGSSVCAVPLKNGTL